MVKTANVKRTSMYVLYVFVPALRLATQLKIILHGDVERGNRRAGRASQKIQTLVDRTTTMKSRGNDHLLPRIATTIKMQVVVMYNIISTIQAYR